MISPNSIVSDGLVLRPFTVLMLLSLLMPFLNQWGQSVAGCLGATQIMR